MKLDISILDRLFPFFFVTGSEGKVVYIGPSLKKLISNAAPRDSFDELFHIHRPANVGFADLSKTRDGEMVVLRMISPKVELMGQIIPIRQAGINLFIMNLVVQDADELTELRLDFNDFAIQDPIFDYLMLLQTQRRAIRQADEANIKLKEAHSIAVRASETKSQFLANMSHELRTPMNGLLGMASILLDTPLSEEQRDYVQTLISSGETLLALVNDILDLSKIEAGFVHLDVKAVGIRELLDEVHATVLPMSQKKGLSVEVTVDHSVPLEIITDRLRLRQVILNLVGNAVKFTLHGSVKVSVDLNAEDGANKLRVRIKDSGIGMSQETLAQLFSPFVQGDSSMTKKFEGTGLGLSICKKLVEAMDGKIEVKSEPGLGSEFTVHLKLVSAG
jgi:signal transduction histidine kinase